jgi:hypothetical protein
MPSNPTPDARALSETSSMIQAMREEGERRMAMFRERMIDRQRPAASTPAPTWNGYPPNCQTGAHWLRWKRQWDTGKAPGMVFLVEWSATSELWAYFGVSGTDDPVRMALDCDYVGPCVQPGPPEPDLLAKMIPCGSKVLWKSRRCFVVSHSFSTNPIPLWSYGLQDCFERRLFTVVSPVPKPEEIRAVEWSDAAR